MSTRDSIRRAAFALLAAVACQNALAQSGLRVRNIRSRCGAFAGKRRRADRLVGAAGAPGATCPSPGGPHDGAGRRPGRADRLSHSGADQGQLGPGQHQRRCDDREFAMAGAGDDKISGFGDRPDAGRAIQSPTCGPTRASAYVLAGQRPLNTAHGRRFIAPVAFSVKPVLNGSTSRDQYRWSQLCRVRTNPEALCRRAGPGGSAILALFRCLTG